MKKLLRIGFDVDEVLSKTVDGFLRFVEERFGFSISFSDFVNYDFNEMVFCEDPEKNSLIVSGFRELAKKPDFFLGLKPYEETVNLIADLKSQGHDISLVTNRPGSLSLATSLWLDGYKVFRDNLSLLGHDEEKGPVVKGLELDAFVDDYHKNLYSIREKHPECQLFLLNRPWNKKCNDFCRISNCREMLLHLNL